MTTVPDKPERRRGRPAFAPTPEQKVLVERLAAFGIPMDDICTMIQNENSGKPIDVNTLMKYFRAELDTGVTKANARVAGALFKNATEHNNVQAQIFWMKTRARWRETAHTIEHTGLNGAPIRTETKTEVTHYAMDEATARRVAEVLITSGAGCDDSSEGSTD